MRFYYLVGIEIKSRKLARSSLRYYETKDKVSGLEDLKNLLLDKEVGTHGELVYVMGNNQMKIVYEGIRESGEVKITKVRRRS